MQGSARNSASAVINSIFSAFIPVVILLAVYSIAGIYPFGDRLLMFPGNEEWYRELIRYHSALMGDSTLFYSVSDGLGGQFYTSFASGFCNPFWLTTSIYSVERFPNMMPAVVPFIMIIQSAFAGFFSYSLLSRLCPQQKLAASAFSAAYAGGSLLILGFLAPQYTGAAVFLPLVGAGIYMLCERGSTVVLFFSMLLFLASGAQLWTTLLLFTVLFFTWCMLVAGEREQIWTKSALLIVCTGLAFGSTAVLLISAQLTRVEFGSAFASLGDIDIAPVGAMISSLFAGSFTSGSAVPLIFCTSVVLLMLPLYYFNPGVALGERQVSFVSLIFILTCFAVPSFGWIWLCSAEKTGTVVGFGCVFCLLAVAAAARSLAESAKSTVRKMMLSWLIIGLLFGASVIIRWGKAPVELLIFSAASLTLMAAITLIVLSTRSISSGFSIVLLFCIACECVLGGTYSLARASSELPLTTVSEYAAQLGKQEWIDSTVLSIESTLPSPFFRIRGAYSPDQCSVTGSASTPSADDFLDAMGIKDGRGFTPFTDAMLGIKYIVPENGPEFGYATVGTDGGDTLLCNSAAMTVGYTVPYTMTDLSSFSADPFAAQNELASAMSGASRSIFSTAEITGCSGIGASITETLTGTEIIRSEPLGYVQFSVLAPSSGMLYMYVSSDNSGEEGASFNGKSVPVSLGAINQLGYCNRGETADIVMTVTDERLVLNGVYFAVLDSQLCSGTISELATRQLSYVAVKRSHIRGTVTVPDGQLLLTTIPYQAGWKAVSGSGEVETCCAAGALLALKLAPGTHSIELWYEPPYFTIAAVISLISFALGVIYATAAEVIRRSSEAADEADELPPEAVFEPEGAFAAEAAYTPQEEYADFAETGKYNEFGEYVYDAGQPQQFGDFAYPAPEQPYPADYFNIYGDVTDFTPVNDTEGEYSEEYYE